MPLWDGERYISRKNTHVTLNLRKGVVALHTKLALQNERTIVVRHKLTLFCNNSLNVLTKRLKIEIIKLLVLYFTFTKLLFSSVRRFSQRVCCIYSLNSIKRQLPWKKYLIQFIVEHTAYPLPNDNKPNFTST